MEQTTTIKTSPKDFFLHLLSNVALYYCAGWLVSLLYDYINYFYGRQSYAYGAEFFSGSMRWAIASLVIVFPVYIIVMRMLNRDMDANPEKRNLRVRKWLMYLTLSLASIALVVDLVALIYQFLSGDYATTFFLKVLAVALVAGLVFAYYFYELRREAGKTAPSRQVFRYGAIALVGVAVIGGFFIVGSPKAARDAQMDSRRVSDLQSVQWQVVNYWQRKQVLPASLDDFNDPISSFVVPSDPVTNESYGYKVLGQRDFALCANFAQFSDNVGDVPQFPRDPKDPTWSHVAGEVCFERTIDSDLYPPLNK